MAILDPINNPAAWDTITIGGVRSPGICKLSGFKRAHSFDRKKGKGSAGETLTFKQLPVATGTVKFQLWLVPSRSDPNAENHFAQWDEFQKLLKYNPTKKAVQPVDIYHPSLASIDIKSVVSENIGAIEEEGPGLFSVTVDLVEYRPPPKKSAVSTPSGSKSNSVKNASGAPPDPIADAQQREIAKLLETARAP